MAKTPRVHMTSDEVAPVVPTWFHFNEGTLTASKSWYFVAPFDGCFFSNDHIFLGWNAAGAADAKIISGNVLDADGGSFLKTKPSFTGAAADEGSTLIGGAGITKGAFKEALSARSFSKGQVLVANIAESVAASDPTGVSITIGLTPFQDKDPDITVAVS